MLYSALVRNAAHPSSSDSWYVNLHVAASWFKFPFAAGSIFWSLYDKLNRIFDVEEREILGQCSQAWRPAEIPPSQEAIVWGEETEIAAQLQIQPARREQ